MNNAQLINQDSGDFEYYTPIEIVEAAREVMGSIDLDPASSALANSKIKAAKFYCYGGLERPWFGNVWLNHPFSRTNNPLWINHLVNWYESMSGRQAINICFASTSEKWFMPLHDYYQCYPFKRVNYYLPNGEKKRGVTKGSVITYLGTNIGEFIEVFSKIGKIRPGAILGRTD